ncbi:MAG TPA: AmmeMemoRadiSam system protein B [Thermoanaerobaculia bacterium]|jgi:AmmeMemoRadiSam system protein B|nr:AmmeMemoRadiSam system protein B [Thermoanaerobaculia bacterium]
MATVRPPAVSGLFYPASAEELRSAVEGYLREAPVPTTPRAPKAVIAPHAGYVYSGPIAGSAFQAFTIAAAASAIERVVLLGPSHFVPFRGLALPGHESFGTPLGTVKLQGAGAQAALRLPQVRIIPEAHVREHSLEVELPFLQVLLGKFELVPLVVGKAEPDEVAEVLDRLWGGPETLIVISSDLSHYLSSDAARRADRETADTILSLGGPLDPRQACGAGPINGLLHAARSRDLTAELLDLRNSADTAGDPSRVVGYGAFAFHEHV